MFLKRPPDISDSIISVDNLQRALSISMQLCLFVLVGSVILGNRLYPSMRSRNSPNCSKLHIIIFNKLMLKSPTITESEFSSHILAHLKNRLHFIVSFP